MMLKIYLLCFLCVLVTPAPFFPTIPSQTYPINQRNEYRIPTSNPTNDFNPCFLQNTAENPPPFDLNQILLNEILSRPSFQAILDPRTASYSLNDEATPSVVNNYIILPMDCLNQNKTDTNCNKRDTKKKSKRKPRNEQYQTELERDKDTLKYNNNIRTTNPTNPSRITEKKRDAINNRNERNSKRDGNERKLKQNDISEIKESIINNDTKTDSNISSQKPRRRRKKAGNDSNNNLTKDNEQINNISPLRVTSKKTIKVADPEDKVPKKLKNELANDFHKTFPNIPEDMANMLMAGMNAFNNPQLNSFFGNYEQFYQSLGTVTHESNKRTKKRRKRKKNRNDRRRNQRTRARNENNITNTPVNAAINPSKSINVDATVNSTKHKVDLNIVGVNAKGTELSDVKIQPVIVNSNPTAEASKSIDATPAVTISAIIDNDEIEEPNATTDFDDGEFDTPSMYYGLIDDYYPLFTDNEAYANNKMLIKSLDSERLVYVSDDTEKMTRHHQYPELSINGREINKDTYDSIEVKTERNFKEVEVQFRQPPLLELPDFITRKVERSEIKPSQLDDNIDLNDRLYVSDFNDKSSSYSNAKTSDSGGLKQSKSKLNNGVETVYARSKVVKYGQVEGPEEAANAEDSWEIFQNDGATYVVAKSLDPGELW